MSNTPMTAPTTGADETLATHDQLHKLAFIAKANVPIFLSDWINTNHYRAVVKAVLANAISEGIVIPATAVPDAELRASVRRLKEISEYASAVLILEGDFGRSTAETKGLTALLDARTLPHDWERTDSWLKHLAGDAARTEEGG